MYHGEVAVKEEKFSHTWKPPHRWGQEELWNLREECSNKYIEDKAQRIWHRDQCQLASPSREVVWTPTTESQGWVLRLRLWESDPRERTGVDSYEGLGLTLSPSEGTSTMQVRESRGKPGSAKKARDHCQRDPQTPGDTLTPQAPSLQDPAFTSGMSWLWSMTPEMGTLANMGFSLGVLSVCPFFY